MWSTQDIRLLRQAPAQAVYRRGFRYCGWLLYGIARICHFLKLRYNSKAKKLETMHYHPIVYKISVTIKWLFLVRQAWHYIVLICVVWIKMFKVENAAGQNFLISLLNEIIIVYVLRRILIFLHSKEDRRVIRQLVNEVIYITRSIEAKLGMIYRCEAGLLGLYLCKLFLVYLILDSMWYKPYFVWINFFYWLLLEYCSITYFLYQLLLLNWYRNFGYFVQQFIEYHQSKSGILHSYHRCLLWLFGMHSRAKRLHHNVQRQLAWLPTALYLGIFISIFNLELLLECVIYAQDDIDNKIYIISDGCLGPAIVPLLNVLILAICSDRLHSEELQLQQQIVIINVLYVRKVYPGDRAIGALYNEVSWRLNFYGKSLSQLLLLILPARFVDCASETGTST